MVVNVGDGEDWKNFTTDRGSADLELAYFGPETALDIINLIRFAENTYQRMTFVAGGIDLSDDGVVGIFDPTGFATNFQRLPCGS